MRERRKFYINALAAICLVGVAFGNPACAASIKAMENERIASQKPSLIVLLTIDSMRNDLLDRYSSVFTGGFTRLLQQGLRFNHAVVDHAPTNSIPGHITIATGCYPRSHGIIDSSWIERNGNEQRFVSGMADESAKIVGFDSLRGFSPKRIRVTGLADWVLSADPDAEVVTIGTGTISSLLYAGHTRRHTYWFSTQAARYVTSTYYMREYPEWVELFHEEEMPKLLEKKTWDSVVPEKYRWLARRDNAEYENSGNGFCGFPHKFEDEVDQDEHKSMQALADWLYFTPFIDESTLIFAQRAVDALKLGQRGATDYLSIVVSSTDHIGHIYGHHSLEQLDTLIRLDKALGGLFNHLDEKVGKGKYIVAACADHGAVLIPEYQRELGREAKRVSREDIEAMFDEIVSEVGKELPVTEGQERRVAEIAKKHDFVAETYTRKDLEDSSGGDEYIRIFRNSCDPDRTPLYPMLSESHDRCLGNYGVIARLSNGAASYLAPSTHGSPYMYDRHVILIFMGAGVPEGVSLDGARTIDIAPSLAHLAGVSFPGSVDGRPLFSTVKKKEKGKK